MQKNLAILSFMKNSDLDINILQKDICAIQITLKQFLLKRMMRLVDLAIFNFPYNQFSVWRRPMGESDRPS